MSRSVPLPTDAAVRRLQAASGYPMVSVLLRTVPGAALAPADRDRLGRLVARAEERIVAELGEEAAATAVAPLRTLAGQLTEAPTARSLALFAGDGIVEAYRLPVDVEERVVVDPTFATRDVLRALVTFPPVRVLALGAGEARLYLAANDQLTAVDDADLPAVDLDADLDRRGHLHQAERTHRRTVRHDRFLRDVDEALRNDPVLGHLPVVVAAAEPALGRFRKLARTPLAGVCRGNHLRRPARDLAVALRPVLRAHVEAGVRADLDLLSDAVDRHQARLGLAEVWASALEGHVHVLLVDPSCRVPAVPVDGGRSLLPHDDAEAPGVLDDAIDELVEIVHRAGGRVRFVPVDALEHGVAAVVR